eukprot:4295313-Prymnesium_polylepis.1
MPSTERCVVFSHHVGVVARPLRLRRPRPLRPRPVLPLFASPASLGFSLPRPLSSRPRSR